MTGTGWGDTVTGILLYSTAATVTLPPCVTAEEGLRLLLRARGPSTGLELCLQVADPGSAFISGVA